jgi:hypothetical protein
VDIKQYFEKNIDSLGYYNRNVCDLLLNQNLYIYPLYGYFGIGWVYDEHLDIFQNHAEFCYMDVFKSPFYDNIRVDNNTDICYWDKLKFICAMPKCWVTTIQKNDEYQYIYIYTRSSDTYYNSYCRVTYEFFEFQKGTYLIDYYDPDSYVNKKNKNGEDISEYYDTECCDYYIIKSKGISVNKISDEAISLEIIEHYFKNKELPRPEAVEKILSVFKPEFDIDEYEQEY